LAVAVDFLTKPVDHKRLIAAVEQALRRDAEQRQERGICSMILQRVEALTRRERQVMSHVIRDRLNKRIAAEIGAEVKVPSASRAEGQWTKGVREDS
jgi:FixJ family two-component response regulator